MTIKLIILLTLCSLIIFIAYKINLYYKSRQCFFDNLRDFCSYMQSEISFLKTDLGQAIKKQKNVYSNEFKKLIDEYEKILNTTKNFENEFKQKLYEINILKEDEKNKIYNFFYMLGKSNVYDQIAQISSFKEQFIDSLKIIKTENLKYGNMSIKLGIILSLAIFIIFI